MCRGELTAVTLQCLPQREGSCRTRCLDLQHSTGHPALSQRGGTSASGKVKDHPEDAGLREGGTAAKAEGGGGGGVKPKASPPLPLIP